MLFVIGLKIRNRLLFVVSYNKPIRSTVLNYKKVENELDFETTIPDSLECKESKYCYQPAGHIITGDLKCITDSRIWYFICKGPKYRFPSQIDFNKCREEICGSLQDSCNRWCKREHVESNA